MIKKNLIPKSIFDESFDKNSIGWCSQDNLPRLFKVKEGTVFVHDIGTLRYIPIARQTRINLITVDNPRKSFSEYIKDFDPKLETSIHPSVKIGSNTIIHKGTIIEDDVVIGDNCTIGADGFGYEEGELINHIGNVVIKSGVHIGNNTCIDKAVLGSTIIGNNVKIDNLVHIAHGVVIGERSLIIAGSVLCGSVRIGSDCWIAPNSSVHQSVVIGDNVTVGLGSVVLKDIESNCTVAGVPAKKINK